MPIVPPDDALRFLARISHTLYASLDYETILRTLARLCVPTLADWCGVDLLDESGKLHRLAVEHVNPERVRLGWELERRYPARPEEPAGAYAVARTGRSELMTEVPDELLVTGARDAEHLALLRALGLSSYLIAPIVAPEHRILGTLILATSNPDRRLDAGDLPLAEELGRRAGLAVDNALTHRAERAARAAAEAAAERSARLLESSMLGIAFWDGDRVTDCNDAYLSLLGYDRGDVRAGKLRLAQVTPPEYAAVDQRALAEIEARGSSTPYEAELLRKDGTRVPVLIARAALEGDGRISFVLDRTEHRLAEERIQASQRMEAVGRLAGGVAHEINNALQGVLGFSAFVRKGLAPDDPLLHDVEQIEHSGRRAASIAQQLLVFGRRQARHPVDLDLGQLGREFTPMLRQALGFERELVLHAPEQPVTVHADRAQLEQVLLNLALNARDAMPGGGRYSVSVSRYAASAGNPVRTVAGALPPGNFAGLEARDTGAGIDPALGANIFEPFFTTKSSGQGTGLGLAVVYGIVRQSGGFVSVDSKLGEGATFRIYLPETGAQPATPAAAAPSESQRGHEVLLLVDDDPLILQVGTRLLSEAGYRVLAASSASEALEILADGHGAERPRLVITDVLMPGTGGRELGERIAHLHPEIPVLYMSGHANDAALAAKVADRRADFIAKPVDPADLLERVRQILDAPHNRRASDRARGT